MPYVQDDKLGGLICFHRLELMVFFVFKIDFVRALEGCTSGAILLQNYSVLGFDLLFNTPTVLLKNILNLDKNDLLFTC